MPPKEVLKETVIAFAEDKGYLFWSIVYLFTVTIVSFFEQFIGTGGLFDYISGYKMRFFIYAFFSGSIIDYVIKANVEITSVRNKFIFKPPIYLRRFRNWTNIAVILGLASPILIMIYWPGIIHMNIYPEYFVEYTHPKMFGIHVLTAYTFLPSFIICLVWSFLGLMLTERDMNDRRIAYFMREMRVERVKRLHRGSVIYLGGIFVAGIIYYKLIHISGLFFYIWNSRVVYNFVKFFREYFGWVEDFAR